MRLDQVKYAVQNIMFRKMRSGLTILSILIGIASIFALVSFGLGLSSYVDNLSDEMGRDKLIIQSKGVGAPGTDETFFIHSTEISFLQKVNGIEEAFGLYMTIAEIESDGELKYVFLMGVPQGKAREIFDQTFTVEIDHGRALKKGDKNKILLGYNYQIANKIYSQPINLNDKIKVNGEIYEVVGFYKSVGNPQDDSNIYVSKEQFEEAFPKKKNKFQFAIAKTAEGYDATSIAEKAEEKLRKFKGQKEGQEDFFIQTFEQAIASFSIILTVINGILVLIALISLIVAGVNIMNTMYTAVLERTQEIGVMKAIGARNSDILLIFLFESGILGIVGGIAGIILGYLIASAGGTIAAQSGYSLLQPIFPLGLSLSCIGFAFIIGAVAGILPARQASKLKPVDALRYE